MIGFLKACGHCGHLAEYHLMDCHDDGKTTGWIECVGCCIRTRVGTFEECVESWNTRAYGWIPVSERMPENHVDVLVFHVGGHILTGWYDEDDREWYGNDWGMGVTHWQPLPAPPAGVK